jgi:hypothetical protein
MTEVSAWIKRSDTICHYKRFLEFSEANSISCRIGFPKTVDLLRLFAESGLKRPTQQPTQECTFGT